MFVGDSLASIFGFKMCLIYVIKYFPEMEQEWFSVDTLAYRSERLG